jgi:uncharacterized glyoxalase superfamily protein PhnB
VTRVTRVTRNRSAPPCTVTPVLVYPDVAAAVEWLVRVFGFVEHVRIADHRAQLGVGDAAMIVADATNDRRPPEPGTGMTHSVKVRVDDVDEHYRRTVEAGAQVVEPLTEHAYGEREYAVLDLAGHRWNFTQSVADVAPEEFGAVTVAPW